MAFAGSSRRGLRAEINITPLVDVVLVLLIIFMVMSPAQLREVDVAVPDTAPVALNTPPPTESQLLVSIDAKDQLSLNHEPLTLAALPARVSPLVASRADKVVFFDIDDDASYGLAVAAMDACRGAGAKTLGLMTK